jgi:ABC-2 type transport system ATP-binding protein
MTVKDARMTAIVEIKDIEKRYDDGFEALSGVNLDIAHGEILALLGPNGAGKTTLISTICGIVQATSGTITVGGNDVVKDYRAARKMIGLVPQEVALEPFEKVISTVTYTRGLFGLKPDAAHIEKTLRSLSLWDKKDSKIMELSGGMKRRVMIAKALSHEPRILFLDEPTAGVDVELRRDMWNVVEGLKADGVTIILTTHYIEEAEAIADRIAVINKGQILLIQDKAELMKQMGQKVLRVDLQQPASTLPDCLSDYNLALATDGLSISYTYDTSSERTGITKLLNELQNAGIILRDIQTQQSSLEDIFFDLVKDKKS